MIFRLEKAQNEIEKTQKSLIHTEKLATLGQMSASLAHEINNPIAGIKNCIRRLNNDASNISQNMEYLSLMNKAVEKIEWVTREYLNFSRFENVTFENNSVAELLNNVLLFISHRNMPAEISITQNINPAELNIYCSARHFEQVLINLINNAIDSIEEKMLIEPECIKKIEVTIFARENQVVVEIRDTGNGIEPEKISAIFDPFFTTKDRSKGTGLGLSVVSSILNLHDATISAESHERAGSTFTIIFPKQTNQ
jgi:two-component system NtrC family sensor kinase